MSGITTNTARRIRKVSSLPATCSPGDCVAKISGGSEGLYVCLASNTWTGPLVASSAVSNAYDIGAQVTGKPAASAVVLNFVAPRNFTLAASGHRAVAGVAATAQTDFAIAANGVAKGTLRFAAAGTVATLVSGASASVTAGQLVTITAPAQDATLADIAFSLFGTI